MITSQPEDAIIKMFSDSISTYINIPFSSNVKPENNVSDDILAFLKSQFDTMGMEPGWIAEALGYLVPHATSIFI